MILDLYITHWTEEYKIGQKAFRMLGLQRGVNWDEIRVTLVHDGSGPFPEQFFSGLPFEMRQICLEHGGIAKARNWCIDDSKADWIKWCDFDDMFSNVYSLRNIMHALEQDPPMDLLWFDMYGEDTETGRVVLSDARDPITVHQKVFRREFMIEHNLRFPEFLTWCEDSAMLAVLEMEIDHQRIGKIKAEAPLYCWIFRKGSLCNREDILFDNLKSFYLRHRYVQDEFKKRGHINEYTMMTVRVLADSCFSLTLAGVKEDTTEHEKEVWNYYQEHKEDLLRLRAHQVQEVIDAVNRENRGCDITVKSFLDWLQSLKEKYGEGAESCLS